MSGFAAYVKKVAARDYDKAESERCRVVRFDGVVLGGSRSREVAERLARVIGADQVDGYVRVVARGES